MKKLFAVMLCAAAISGCWFDEDDTPSYPSEPEYRFNVTDSFGNEMNARVYVWDAESSIFAKKTEAVDGWTPYMNLIVEDNTVEVWASDNGTAIDGVSWVYFYAPVTFSEESKNRYSSRIVLEATLD